MSCRYPSCRSHTDIFSEHGKRMLKQDEYLWSVGKWEGCPGCDYLRSAEKVTKTWLWTNTPKNLFIDDSNSKSCCLCHKHLCKDDRKVGIGNLQIWVKDCWVLWAGCFSFEVLCYQRNETGEVLSETKLLWDRKRLRRCRHKLGFQLM